MRTRAIESLLALLALALAGFAWRRADAVSTAAAAVPVPPVVRKAQLRLSDAEMNVASARLIERNPFRLNRMPALIRVGQPLPAGPQPRDAAPARTRPMLAVRAIIGGPPWAALLDGLPQSEATTVVKEGAQFGPLTITAISRDTVVVTAADTVWRLTLKREQR